MNKLGMFFRELGREFYDEVLAETFDDLKDSFKEIKDIIASYGEYRRDKKEQRLNKEADRLATLTRWTGEYGTHLFDAALKDEKQSENEKNYGECFAMAEAAENKYFRLVMEAALDEAPKGAKKSDVFLKLARELHFQKRKLHDILFVVDDKALFENEEFLANLQGADDSEEEKAITIDETDTIRVLDSSKLSRDLLKKIYRSNYYRGCISAISRAYEDMKKMYLQALYEEYKKAAKKNDGVVDGDYKKCFELIEALAFVDEKRKELLLGGKKDGTGLEIRAEIDWDLLNKRERIAKKLDEETDSFMESKLADEGRQRD